MNLSQTNRDLVRSHGNLIIVLIKIKKNKTNILNITEYNWDNWDFLGEGTYKRTKIPFRIFMLIIHH